MFSVLMAAAGLPVTALLLAQTDASPELFSPRVLGVLGPFFGLLVGLLWRAEKKRDEAELLNRQLYQAVIDKYEPAMQAVKSETLAVLKDVVTELHEARDQRRFR